MKRSSATGVFITGTDTGCGKTRVTLALMDALRQRSLTVAGMKPVASGGRRAGRGWCNEDALQIQAACSSDTSYELINPWVFPEAIAPHLASQRVGTEITPRPVLDAWHELAEQAQVIVVEGAGGWRVPLSGALDLPGLVRELGLPVILVVGLRLGCINHARLTAEAIQGDGFSLLGWVGNHVDPDYGEVTETMAYLTEALPSPCLGKLPWQAPQAVADPGGMLAVEMLMQRLGRPL